MGNTCSANAWSIGPLTRNRRSCWSGRLIRTAVPATGVRSPKLSAPPAEDVPHGCDPRPLTPPPGRSATAGRHLRLVPGGADAAPISPRTYRRRRLVAGLLAVLVLAGLVVGSRGAARAAGRAGLRRPRRRGRRDRRARPSVVVPARRHALDHRPPGPSPAATSGRWSTSSSPPTARRRCSPATRIAVPGRARPTSPAGVPVASAAVASRARALPGLRQPSTTRSSTRARPTTARRSGAGASA